MAMIHAQVVPTCCSLGVQYTNKNSKYRFRIVERSLVCIKKLYMFILLFVLLIEYNYIIYDIYPHLQRLGKLLTEHHVI